MGKRPTQHRLINPNVQYVRKGKHGLIRIRNIGFGKNYQQTAKELQIGQVKKQIMLG